MAPEEPQTLKANGTLPATRRCRRWLARAAEKATPIWCCLNRRGRAWADHAASLELKKQPRNPCAALLTPPSVQGYPAGMRLLRVPMLVLAVTQAALAGLTAMVGAFADGGDIWSRLVVVLLHPLSAASLLLLVLSPRLSRAKMLAIAALLLATVAADLWLALAIGRGVVKGDWGLPVVFSVIPALGVVYALILARAPTRSSPA